MEYIHQLISSFCSTVSDVSKKRKNRATKFDGNEKCNFAWLNKEEEYFEIYDIDSDEKKIRHNSMKMEGKAYNWYMWWEEDDNRHQLEKI